ncbi:hypothetical protein NIES2101_28260 [Calothrix sp. HK-06]|nr:hypothetical protein NIES2101_28260 [Calothrix sp. HK-06]
MTTSFNSAEIVKASTLSGVFRTPDIKIVQYIEDFSVLSCTQELSKTILDPINAAIACAALNASANHKPADSFSDSSWNVFKNSKDYRGFSHIPSVEVNCNNGLIVSYAIPTIEFSYGYTNIAIFGYEASEPYTASEFNGFNVTTNSQNDALVVQEQRAARLSRTARIGQATITAYDVPFIYIKLNGNFKFDGSSSVINIDSATFPTIRVYINNELRVSRPQANLANFIKSGGKVKNFGLGAFDLSAPGEGNWAPAGEPIQLIILPLK